MMNCQTCEEAIAELHELQYWLMRFPQYKKARHMQHWVETLQQTTELMARANKVAVLRIGHKKKS